MQNGDPVNRLQTRLEVIKFTLGRFCFCLIRFEFIRSQIYLKGFTN